MWKCVRDIYECVCAFLCMWSSWHILSDTLQHNATHCHTLQHIATPCNARHFAPLPHGRIFGYVKFVTYSVKFVTIRGDMSVLYMHICVHISTYIHICIYICTWGKCKLIFHKKNDLLHSKQKWGIWWHAWCCICMTKHICMFVYMYVRGVITNSFSKKNKKKGVSWRAWCWGLRAWGHCRRGLRLKIICAHFLLFRRWRWRFVTRLQCMEFVTTKYCMEFVSHSEYIMCALCLLFWRWRFVTLTMAVRDSSMIHGVPLCYFSVYYEQFTNRHRQSHELPSTRSWYMEYFGAGHCGSWPV